MTYHFGETSNKGLGVNPMFYLNNCFVSTLFSHTRADLSLLFPGQAWRPEQLKL